MTGDESGALHQTSRRMLLRNAVLVGAGAAVVGVTSTSLAGSAQAAPARLSRTQPLATPDSAAAIQWSWAWCSKCQGLYYAHSTGGNCPADHKAHGGEKSYNYGLYYNGSGTGYQAGWDYCRNCEGLFYSKNGTSNESCPFFGGAEAHYGQGSYNYIIFNGSGSYTNGQAGWRWCWQCQGMFYANKNSRAGVCPLENGAFSHNGNGSYAYQLMDNPA